MTLEETENAETVEDAYIGLMETVYNGVIKKGSPEWSEGRKIFFCGAAFLLSRVARLSKDPDKVKKLTALINELKRFAVDVKSIGDMQKDIENAGRYGTTD